MPSTSPSPLCPSAASSVKWAHGSRFLQVLVVRIKQADARGALGAVGTDSANTAVTALTTACRALLQVVEEQVRIHSYS